MERAQEGAQAARVDAFEGDGAAPAAAPAPAASEPLERGDLQLGGAGGVLGSPPIMSALAFGLFMSWVYLACFSSKLFPDFGATGGFAPVAQIASFAGYLGWIALAVARYRRLVVRWGWRVMLFAALAAAGTACSVAASFVGDAQAALAIVCCSSVATGVGTGCMLVAWTLQFVHGRGHAAVQVGGGLVVSFAVTCAVLLLPFAASAAVITALPVACGLAIVRASALVAAQPGGCDDPEPSTDKAAIRLPWRLALGLSALGLVYGLAYGFAFEYAPTGIEVSIGCLLVNGIVGAAVLVCALRYGKNFGYTVATLAILPIAGFAQCMIAVLQTDLLPVSFFIMRLAYMLFDVTLWMQLPKVYEHIHTVRTFLVSRLVLEGSSAAGIVLRELLSYTGFEVFDAVALAALALLLVALTAALHGQSVGTVWDLMPEPEMHTGKFRRACGRIAADGGLTPREAEVMRLVVRGRSGTFVQDKLFISKSTFQTHMRNLYKKLDVHSNQELLDLLERTLDEANPPDRP